MSSAQLLIKNPQNKAKLCSHRQKKKATAVTVIIIIFYDQYQVNGFLK